MKMPDQERLPGLMFQLQIAAQGSACYTYLGDSCSAVLGVSQEALLADATLFEGLLLESDRPSFQHAMRLATAAMSPCNWEGRIRIAEWRDIKWINLRCRPTRLALGSIQWDGFITNITHGKQVEAELLHSRARLAELSSHVERVKEQERARIAREIHDDLGGNLSAIKMALAMLTSRLPQGDVQLNERATYLDTLIDRSIDAVHRIAGDLRPVILDFGLVAALRWQASEFAKQSGIPCQFTSNQEQISLPDEVATALFRIVQEGLNNIAKHARASQTQLDFCVTADSLLLEIKDNGCGIQALDKKKPQSFGLRGIQERVNAMQGSMTINSATIGGSVMLIQIPTRCT